VSAFAFVLMREREIVPIPGARTGPHADPRP
jgi:hypothetical protein